MTVRRYLLRLGIATLGIAAAAGILLTDDRDPVVFTIPILVLTLVVVAVLTIADRGGAADDPRRMADEAGLDYDGVAPLPAVTPILRDVREPAHVLSGELYPEGPDVRVARLRERLVAVTEAPADAVDAGTREWLDEHPLRPDAAVEDGLLVVAVAGGTEPRELLALARQLHTRL